jgi:hypothetical protein
VTNSDLARSLANPVLARLAAAENSASATSVTGSRLPSAAAHKVDLAANIHAYYESAIPLVAPKTTQDEQGFLLMPASDKGKAFGERAKKAVPHLELVLVPGQSDLMFCREEGNMGAEDLRPFIKHCRLAYDELAVVPNSSPHARFDITDWVPLDP